MESVRSMKERILILLPTHSYKAEDFMRAARALELEVVIGTDRKQALDAAAPGGVLALDFARPDRAVETIRTRTASSGFDAVIGVDDETTVLAAMTAEVLGLRGNPVEAVRTIGDKHAMRTALADGGLRTPSFRRIAVDTDPVAAAIHVDYPCVLKPLFLSASRGVIRADDPDEFVAAFRRIAAILNLPDVARRAGDRAHLIVEGYVPGVEVAVEGLLADGTLRVLALFDKPDPLQGPVFEETLYVTPSRLPLATRRAVEQETATGCRALGLREGPVHAELRLNEGVPWLLEVALRSIGGLCSRTLRFGAGLSLEELILRHLLGRETPVPDRESAASGVMMIPIPRAGRLSGVSGLDAARAVPGIEEITISRHAGAELVPLPEGHRYLGFIFARDDTPEAVESALRESHGLLEFAISDPNGQ